MKKQAHDYLIWIAICILLIAALGAFALHYGGTTAAAGNAVYHPCQELYQEYYRHNCNWLPEQYECQKIMIEMQRRGCI